VASPPRRRSPPSLQSPIETIDGAGPQLAASLRGIGLHSVLDLLFHLPLRYEDRRAPVPLRALQHGQEALVRGRVVGAEVRMAGRRSLRVVIEQDGAALALRFFHFNDAQRRAFAAGRWVQAFGGVRVGRSGAEMAHPDYRLADSVDSLTVDDTLTPVYGLTAGVTQGRLRRLIARALQLAAHEPSLSAPLPGLPAPDSLSALRVIHAPVTEQDCRLLLAREHPAQQRLIQEELLAHQLCLRLARQALRDRPAPVIAGADVAAQRLEQVLPFRYTAAQRRVIAELGADLALRRPMLRLVQGDVGSGKTAVAAAALLAVVQAGFQGALMAPTELLAEQHQVSLGRWLEPLGVSVALLTGRLRKAERAARTQALADGSLDVVVGTHALFQEEVRFARLGLAVVDEQHRFGVQQRLALRDKGAAGAAPHQLILSATPIPRTLAQTVYADLDVSVIDELPPGRTPVLTVAINNRRREDVLVRVGEACRAGRQVYWVCTLIEESEALAAEAAEAAAERLRAELPDVPIGLVHGRLKAADKEAQMRAFKQGELAVLVATTVIEVGVDVPNASIMVIENSERLGLAQLHQLRGRVGRGAQASQCVLMYQEPLSDAGRQRLETMRSTHDGFVIAQKDLELRGPGEFLGRRQTGLVGLRLADPLRDAAVIPGLQQLADRWLHEEPARTQDLIRRWVGDQARYAQV
jgi:ATP-dependent DNA helicase RecG